ncbi:MAG TPA: hypothetical protein VKX28_13965 [Xanthobacteraceae bacterium]|nr:hypothetical protein [Xanthobacteraceae bacterium]
MKVRTKIVLAAIVASSFAAPVMAGEWVYHGGPKSPDSLTTYVPYDSAYYGGPYGGPPYGYGYWHGSPEVGD